MNSKILTFVIALFISTSSQAAFKCLDSFRKILTGESRQDFRVLKGHDRYWRYRKYENGEVFVAKKNKLFQKIEFWAEIGERDIRLRELRIKQARSLVEESIKLDRPEITFVTLRPMFTRIQISYFKMQRNNFMFEKLSSARKLVLEGDIVQAGKIIAELKKVNRLEYKISSSKPKISQIDYALTKIENSNIDITIEFAKKYAEYTSTIDSLTYLSTKTGKIGEKAKEVLELLKPENLISEQLDYFSQFDSIEHITKPMMREIVIENRISEIIYLKRELMMEKWTSLVGRMSATQIYELTDLIIKRFPFLNTPSVRSHIRYTVDNKEVLTHYPNIDRMIADGNSPKVMWEYLLSLDARDRTTDSLIRTFARRIDTREEWRSVKLYGKHRSEKLKAEGHGFDLEVRLYDKMIEMEKSVMSLPPLAPWHRSGSTKFVRFLIDGIVLGAFVYGGYYFIGDFLDFSSDESEEEDKEATEAALEILDMNSGSNSSNNRSSSPLPPPLLEESINDLRESTLNELPIKPTDIESIIELDATIKCDALSCYP